MEPRDQGGLLFDEFDVRALKDCNIRELCRGLISPELHNQQPGSHDFNNETPDRYCSGNAPDMQLILISPDTDMDSRLFDSGGKPGKQVRLEPDVRVQGDGPLTLLRRQKCN